MKKHLWHQFFVKKVFTVKEFEFSGDVFHRYTAQAWAYRISHICQHIHGYSWKQCLKQCCFKLYGVPLIFWWYAYHMEHRQEELDKFVNVLNSARHMIGFTVHHSMHSVNFLNMTITVREDELSTTRNKKTTKKQQYFHFHSHHPQHCEVGTQQSEHKLCRICSGGIDYSRKLGYSARHYPGSLLNESCQKVLHKLD